MCKFIIRTGKHHQFFFDLKAETGDVILSSEAFHTKAACNTGIEALKAVASDDNKFERMKSADDHFYFVIKAANGKAIAKSVLFANPADRNAAIKSIETEAHDAVTVEQ
ncbi:YegP family protein [Chitinophaga sp. GbtcB8]|uniref:YegP family protein n=1 Tax=Chitinophaga sp. GbtcB8 TaxID=2824753 RepID=UPI001C310814|nr:YegP family protein [Chitinophaga sp. GbtcB8]